jgi:mxaJ protein
MVRNIVGYSVLGDYSQPNPPARIVDAVVNGDVDAAIVWGPLAGYFASRAPVALDIAPVAPQQEGPFPFAFDISMAVRRQDAALKRRLDRFIDARRAEIDALLARYAVPRADRGKRTP